MCVGEGRWVGPRMTCSPRRCGHPGDIQHGRREGNVFIFPNRVTYICNEGYELVGRPFRECMANGQWSGQEPLCKPVRCARLSAPANGHMHGKDFTYSAIVRFSCFRGFRLVGSQARRCRRDGTWSGQTATCAMVDCGVPGPFYNGYLDGQQTTFGAIIIFRCFGRTTFEGESIKTTCQENGQWTHPVPMCWKKCEIPQITNGSVIDHRVGQHVNHGHKISFNCEGGHNLNTTDESTCHNGTWSFLPVCDPAPCDSERPKDIREGFVRFHGVLHGDKAKYRCNTGYRLVGDTFITCSYGRWVGTEPDCEPLYCPYPGTIKNGQILLVGVIGKYEYRPYVRRIGHNEQIEFQCNKGYKRVGPHAATCVDGQWSPDSKPYCVPVQHPRLLYIFRGKRSAGAVDTRKLHPVSERSRIRTNSGFHGATHSNGGHRTTAHDQNQTEAGGGVQNEAVDPLTKAIKKGGFQDIKRQ